MFPYITIFGIVFAVICAYFKFAFKLSIIPSGPIDTTNPFSTPFILKNDSLLSIYNVRPHRCIIRNINKLSMGVNVNLVAPPISRLAPGESTTFILPISELVFPEKIDFINIEIGVFYNPAFLPFYEKSKYSRFVTFQRGTKLEWISKSMSE